MPRKEASPQPPAMHESSFPDKMRYRCLEASAGVAPERCRNYERLFCGRFACFCEPGPTAHLLTRVAALAGSPCERVPAAVRSSGGAGTPRPAGAALPGAAAGARRALPPGSALCRGCGRAVRPEPCGGREAQVAGPPRADISGGAEPAPQSPALQSHGGGAGWARPNMAAAPAAALA